jgi:hypothetical protein
MTSFRFVWDFSVDSIVAFCLWSLSDTLKDDFISFCVILSSRLYCLHCLRSFSDTLKDDFISFCVIIFCRHNRLHCLWSFNDPISAQYLHINPDFVIVFLVRCIVMFWLCGIFIDKAKDMCWFLIVYIHIVLLW